MKRLLFALCFVALAATAQAQGTATGIGYWKGVTAPTFGSVTVDNAGCIGWADAVFCREGAGIIQFGVDAAGTIAYTLKGNDRVTSDGAGGDVIIAGGRNRGASAGGSVIFQTAPAAGAGVTGTLATVATIGSTGTLTLFGSRTLDSSGGDLLLGGTGNVRISTGAAVIWNNDNTTDIGAVGATRPRTGYFGTSVISPIYQGSGTGTTVANVGANSCGTTAATIAGNQVSGVITVGATAGTQCRVTFTTAAPVARDCTVTDSTTTIATRATVVDTSNTDFLGAFVAGDKITYQCTVR